MSARTKALEYTDRMPYKSLRDNEEVRFLVAYAFEQGYEKGNFEGYLEACHDLEGE